MWHECKRHIHYGNTVRQIIFCDFNFFPLTFIRGILDHIMTFIISFRHVYDTIMHCKYSEFLCIFVQKIKDEPIDSLSYHLDTYVWHHNALQIF